MVTERLWVEASSARYPIYISPDLEILLQEKLAYHLNGQTGLSPMIQWPTFICR